MESLSINNYTAAGCTYYVSRYSNNTFDKVSSCIKRIVKNNNISSFGRMEKISYFVYQYIFVSMKTWFHAFPIHAEALSRESDNRNINSVKAIVSINSRMRRVCFSDTLWFQL